VQSVSNRITRLEQATGAGACEACGALPDGKWPADVRVVIDTNPGGKPFVPEHCPECGRQTNFTLGIGAAGSGDE
jgi:hypothetical protein